MMAARQIRRLCCPVDTLLAKRPSAGWSRDGNRAADASNARIARGKAHWLIAFAFIFDGILFLCSKLKQGLVGD